MKTMKVKATLHRVPREDDHRRYIDTTEAREVPASSMYYHRRLADGELEIVGDDGKKGE